VHVFDFKTGTDQLPYRAPSDPSTSYALTWSADSQNLLITRGTQEPTRYYLWSVAEPLTTTEVDAANVASVADWTTGASAAIAKLPASSAARGASSSSDGKRILYWNDLELHVYDVASHSDELVTRLSRNIEKAVWYADDRLIVYATSDGLFAVESGHEGARVTTSLAAMQDLTDFAISKSGDLAWLVGAVGHQQGVFSLKLQ